MPTKEFLVSLPRHPIPSRAAIEPLPPDPFDTPIELQKALRVCRAAVVLVVASELGVEGLLLLVHHRMPVLLAPFGDRREAPTEPLAHRPHMHCELPSPAAGANVRQTEKVEGAGFLLALPGLALNHSGSGTRSDPAISSIAHAAWRGGKLLRGRYRR